MLDKLFDIVENKKYKYAEYKIRDNGSYLLRDSYIKIYTKNGAYIKIIKDWFIDGRLFRGHRVDRYYISFFIPDKDTSVASYSIRNDKSEIMYSKIDKLYKDMQQNIKDDAIEKYF